MRFVRSWRPLQPPGGFPHPIPVSKGPRPRLLVSRRPEISCHVGEGSGYGGAPPGIGRRVAGERRERCRSALRSRKRGQSRLPIAYPWEMPILHSFKQTVLDLGRGEAKTKARPLAVGDETLDRSAAGLDRRDSERAVLFWLLSDRALFYVVGNDPSDYAYRIPYEAFSDISLVYDERSEFLPWYVEMSISPEGEGAITRLEQGTIPGQPFGVLPPVPVDGEERARFARGEVVPLSGFGACPRKFRSALERRMELAGASLSVEGSDAAERKHRAMRRKISN